MQDFLGRHEQVVFTKCFRISHDLAERLGNIWGKTINGVNSSCIVEQMSVDEVTEFLNKQNPKNVLCLGARIGAMTKVLNDLENRPGNLYDKHHVYASIADNDGNKAVAPSSDVGIFTTFDGSKGMERPICVVFDFTEEYWSSRTSKPMARYEILRNLFCVAASRGKQRIIFVNSDHPLSDKSLMTPTETLRGFPHPFAFSEMFDHKFIEDVDACYKLLEVTPIEHNDNTTIDVQAADAMIDLSPCISIYIFEITQKINNSLHFKFGMTDLQDRMIFTACALVAQRYNPQNGLQKLKDMDYSTFHNWIYSALSKALEDDKKQNSKLDVLLEEYASVRMSITENQEAINDFIDNVCQIADLVNSDNWNGEDVMAIFFNEFNRYRGKAQAGQVFTPDHIASFMYRLIDVNMNDRVLDATCGSGTFLVKSMCNMIREAGGSNTSKAKQIKSEQLFGIEMYRKVYALACANMMIHKDGKTNLVQMDATSAEATEWIRKQKITKALMNPPYERRYGCATIVANVLDSVPAGTKCAFILPDKKMEKESKLKALLERHTLTTIIKLPENLFFGLGVTTSIFIFETGKPQNGRNIKGYYVADDGLETVKNKGRQDVHDKWPALEDYWVKAIQDDNDDRYNTRQLINPAEHLSYQMPEKPFELYEEDFIKTVMDYEMYKRGINAKEFGDKLLQKVLYGSTVTGTEEGTNILVGKGESNNGED